MNDIRRTVLWVIFGFSMVLLWDQWQVYNGNKATFFPSPSNSKAAATAAPTNTNALTGGIGSNSVLPNVGPTTSAAADTGTRASEKIQIKTDLLRLTLDTEGASLVRSEFLKLHDLVNQDKDFVLFQQDIDRVYMAQTGLIAAAPGVAYPTHKTVMTMTSSDKEMKDGQNELSVRFESPDLNGVKLIKTYTFKRGSYAIAVRHEVVNTGAASASAQVYVQLVRDGVVPASSMMGPSSFTGPAAYTEGKKYHKIEFKDIDNNKAEIDKSASTGYVAMVQHYFVSAWLLADGINRENFVRKLSDTQPVLYAVGAITPLGEIAPGARQAVEATLFLGPQEEKVLEALSPGLELVKDYGMLTLLAKPLFWLLDQLHKVLQNWGWSIVALVVLLKIAFYWLNAKAYASMAKMKAINPRIMEMRERLKDNPQQMQQEMMKIYREEKVNPMGGCLPIVVQIPVFIALYWVLLSSVEMRNAPWILWIQDLSAIDPYYILPVVMTLSTLVQTALNPAPPDPMQAKMMWIMPLVFSVMFFAFPAGLVLYWLTNNILSIAQQWFINKRMGVPPQFNLPKFR
jgi:YidC/Oxa1 family membrane protein insertase